MLRDFAESFSFNGRIDEANKKIHRVAILSSISKNNRLYLDSALESLVQIIKQNPTKSFIDHAPSGQSVLNLLGEFTNPQKQGGTVFADLTVFSSSRGCDLLFDIAKNHSSLAGFSIMAKGAFREGLDDNNREVVEKIVALRSIDLVCEPAAVSGVFESKEAMSSFDVSKSFGDLHSSHRCQKEQFWRELNEFL
jgi:hypothetical protein